MPEIEICGRRLEYEHLAGDLPAIVLLHEGLGSVAMWKEFPQQLAHATGRAVLAYSRQGYGRSEALTAPRAVDYMHVEALEVLPRLLDMLGIASPVLLGHSDGASIALIHAGGCPRGVSAVIALAPHVMVEPISIRSIRAAREAYERGALRERLAPYHLHVDSAFRGWNDIWLHPGFLDWNIEEYLPRIACPLLVIQGTHDEYGTFEQVRRIERAVPGTEVLALDGCGHAPHRERPDAVLAAIARFLR